MGGHLVDHSTTKETLATPRACLTPDQVEAIARQQTGRHQPDLMRLQQGTGDLKRPNSAIER